MSEAERVDELPLRLQSRQWCVTDSDRREPDRCFPVPHSGIHPLPEDTPEHASRRIEFSKPLIRLVPLQRNFRRRKANPGRVKDLDVIPGLADPLPSFDGRPCVAEWIRPGPIARPALRVSQKRGGAPLDVVGRPVRNPRATGVASDLELNVVLASQSSREGVGGHPPSGQNRRRGARLT